MAANSSSCSLKFLVSLLLLSAIPFAYIISLELSPPDSHIFHYHSSGFFRECAKWDPLNRRFLISMMENGVSQLVPDANVSVLTETVAIRDPDLSGNASVGLFVDPPRNRLLVVYADLWWNQFSALAAYDLSTWRRLFLTVLSGRGEKSFADDVAIDALGDAYVTDVKSSKIWRISKDGELMGSITSPLFSPNPKQLFKDLAGLNGIVYHPDGYLIVIHTRRGALFKVDITSGDAQVSLISVSVGSLAFGDGLELVSPTQIVVAGMPSVRLVESLDGWRTGKVISTFKTLTHRIPSAATIKDGRIYVNHILGIGYPRMRHALVEAVFTS